MYIGSRQPPQAAYHARLSSCRHGGEALHIQGQAQRAKAWGQTWYSMLGSYRLFLQMAHVSVQMAHDHMATAFHFLISNRFPFAGLATALPVDGPAGSTSISSTSP